jgi:hypothetical protein
MTRSSAAASWAAPSFNLRPCCLLNCAANCARSGLRHRYPGTIDQSAERRNDRSRLQLSRYQSLQAWSFQENHAQTALQAWWVSPAFVGIDVVHFSKTRLPSLGPLRDFKRLLDLGQSLTDSAFVSLRTLSTVSHSTALVAFHVAHVRALSCRSIRSIPKYTIPNQRQYRNRAGLNTTSNDHFDFHISGDIG